MPPMVSPNSPYNTSLISVRIHNENPGERCGLPVVRYRNGRSGLGGWICRRLFSVVL